MIADINADVQTVYAVALVQEEFAHRSAAANCIEHPSVKATDVEARGYRTVA